MPREDMTHVCLDCGALGVSGGYHDHGGGNAGEPIALADLPRLMSTFQAIENDKDSAEEELADARAQAEALAEALDGLLRPCVEYEEKEAARAALRAFRSSQESSDAT